MTDTDYRLRVSVNKEERNVITGQAIKLIANDMRDAWKLVSKSIEPLLEVNGSHRCPAPHVSNEEVAELLKAIDALDGEVSMRSIVWFEC